MDLELIVPPRLHPVMKLMKY